MLSALAHSMRRDHVHLWIKFVFCSNTCVSLNITKTNLVPRAFEERCEGQHILLNVEQTLKSCAK